MTTTEATTPPMTTEQQLALTNELIARGVTHSQLNFLMKLVRERLNDALGASVEEREEGLRRRLLAYKPDKREVSMWIDAQKKKPIDTMALRARTRVDDRPTVHPEIRKGIYVVDEKIYGVVLTRDKSRLYAKVLVESPDRLNENDEVVPYDWAYAQGVIYQLKPEHRVTLDDAEKLAIRYGRCLDCGHRLKAAKSVQRGIGPVCARGYR